MTLSVHLFRNLARISLSSVGVAGSQSHSSPVKVITSSDHNLSPVRCDGVGAFSSRPHYWTCRMPTRVVSDPGRIPPVDCKWLCCRHLFLLFYRIMAEQKERTFIAIKPDGVQRGIIGEIIKRFEAKGFKLVGMKMMHVSKPFLVYHL